MKGEGSISFHKASNRYIAQYTKPNGKRGTVYGKTREEARKKLTKALSDIQSNTYTDKSKITLIEITKSIVKDRHNSNKTGENAYRTNLDTIKRIEKDDISTMQIQKITIEHIKEYFNTISKQYSNSIIRKHYGIINASFRRAITKGYIIRNPFDNKEELQIPKSIKKDKKVSSLTLSEQRKLIEALDNYNNRIYKNIILLALYSGMRSGEILALKINDIDFKNKVIHIQRTLTKDVNAKTIIGENTKTINSLRDIKITTIIEKILKESMKMFRFNENNLVFCTSEGKLITNGMINSAFKRLCEKYNINKGFDVNFHMLRHTYATTCIESGMPAKVVQKKLGHRDISITLNTYAEVLANYEEIYCSNIYQNGKTCKEVGHFKTQQKLMKENDNLRIYRNVYQKLLLRTRRNPMNDEYEKEFQDFKQKNIELKEKVNNGKLMQEQYMEWLTKQ